MQMDENAVLDPPTITDFGKGSQVIYGDTSTILKYICVEAPMMAVERKDP